MSNEDYLYKLCTETTTGGKWALGMMATFYEIEQKQIEHHGRFFIEDEVKQTFRESFAPALETSVSNIKEEDVDWDLLYTKFRDWYKNIGESADNNKGEQNTLKTETRGNFNENPFYELKTNDDEIVRRKYYEKGLQLAEKYHPIVTRVLPLYAKILPVEYKSSHGNIEYSTFLPHFDVFNTKRIYSWNLYTHEPTSGNPSMLEIELSCMPAGVHYISVRLWDKEDSFGEEKINLDLSDEEIEHNLIDVIKSLHRELVG